MTTVLVSLNAGLKHAFETNPRVYLLGEDILDPYGGAFKVTRGLSSAYPERVLTTPVSEAGITGIAGGMALRGLRPVVEIMFGDFLTLAADQITNYLAKFRWMYAEQVEAPVVIRTPMGGRRGYGPTHSQTLEKMFLGIPGLTVLAASAFINPGELLANAILKAHGAVLFVENKLLYLLPVFDASIQAELDYREYLQDDGQLAAPTVRLTLHGAPPAQVTLVAYGYMAELARQAMVRLAYEHEIFAELVVPSQLSPIDMEIILDSLRHTGKLLTLEEGSLTLGWGAEVISRSFEALGPRLRAGRRVTAWDHPVPASPVLENASLPTVEQICAACIELARDS